MFTNCSFEERKNKLDCYKGEDCMERLWKDLREYAMKITNYEEKEMIPLTSEESRTYKIQIVCHICKKGFSSDKNAF